MRTVIAIDGPSGAGKSTVAKIVAERLGIEYIDTGAMYRAAALYLSRNKTDINNAEELHFAIENMDIGFDNGAAIMNREDVSGLIRTPEITKFASVVSALAAVREKLVVLQRSMGAEKSVVLDGRDIGTNVFPDTEFKFFVTASPDVRAKRRFDEMKAKDEKPNLDEVLDAINKRDYDDMHRELNPLVQASDASLIITDEMTAGQVADVIIEAVVKE